MSYTCVILVNKHLCRRLRWQLKTFWLKEVWNLLTVRQIELRSLKSKQFKKTHKEM